MLVGKKVGWTDRKASEKNKGENGDQRNNKLPKDGGKERI